MASLLVGYIATAMRPPRALPSHNIHCAGRDHYLADEALDCLRHLGETARSIGIEAASPRQPQGVQLAGNHRHQGR